MLQNQKGQALLTVMLVTLVFTVLGLTIVASTLGGLKRTEIRVDDIDLTAKTTKTLNELIAQFQTEIEDEDEDSTRFKLTNENSLPFISQNLKSLTDRLQANVTTGKLVITDVSKTDYNIETGTYLTRAYDFSYTLTENNLKKTASKRVFLSPTPSFLNYAAGTGDTGTMHLNGASEFDGNIYTDKLETKNIADYYDESSINEVAQKADTRFPKLDGKALIRSTINNENILSQYSLLKGFFEEDSKAVFQKDTESYVGLEFDSSIAQVLKTITGSSDYYQIIESKGIDAGINEAIGSLLEPCKGSIIRWLVNDEEDKGSCDNSVQLINMDIRNLTKINTLNSEFNQTVIYSYVDLTNSPLGGKKISSLPLTISENFELASDKWMIVNGDLKIAAASNKPIKLSGNILVTGNLIIQGNEDDRGGTSGTDEDDEVLVDSTMYVLGNTNISNTNIKGLLDERQNVKQLVAMTKGELNVSRINEFRNYKVDGKELQPLDAFLYSNGTAKLYGVGSIFHINGGIFAKDYLEINAIRQDSILRATKLKPGIESRLRQKGQNSRFKVTHDSSVLIDQMDALPRVDRYQVIMDDTLVSR